MSTRLTTKATLVPSGDTAGPPACTMLPMTFSAIWACLLKSLSALLMVPTVAPMWHHPWMEFSEFVRALDRDSMAFVDACEVAGLTTEVPSCPGWTVADLLWHLTEVHDFWRTIVAEQRISWEGYEQPPRPSDEGLAELYRRGRTDLLQTLGGADPATPLWTWSKDGTAGFVIRRMTQETAVHLWDATQAAGLVNPLEPALASDGIDEFLTHFLPDVAVGAESMSAGRSTCTAATCRGSGRSATATTVSS